MEDRTAGQTSGLTSPLTRYFRVAAENEDELPFLPRAILLPAATALTVYSTDTEEASFTFATGELAAGVWHPMRPTLIESNTGDVIIAD